MSKFGKTLKQLMVERAVTPKALSKATQIPVSTLSEWISGRTPRLDEPLVRLSRFFGVSLEFLVTGEAQEKDIVESVTASLSKGFNVIHQGVYRVTIEREKKDEK